MTHSPASALSLLAALATLAALSPAQLPAADSSTATPPPQSLMPPGGWKAGVHYDVLPQQQPMQVAPGQIEVIEFFWFACPHCYAFEPDVKQWQKSKPPQVKFTRVHVVWNPQSEAHARLFYALGELGRQDLYDAAFEAIHKEGNPLFVPRDPDGTLRAHIEFAKAHGITEDNFRKAYLSPAMQSRIQKAAELLRNYRVTGVPTMAVAGKYTADIRKAGGKSHLIELVNDLVAVETR